ncbi:MAG TPA: F0F1 ATP synthase subunit A [Ktedonobacteraceae bacterium]|nr:F0F1 ATP synthase subunit A [Ktedonobacteraceae bacterium]
MQLWKLPNISIAPEVIFGSWITNTLLCTWISIIILFVLFYFGIRRRDLIPSGWQNFIEWMVESLLGLVESVSGKEKGRKFFPIVAPFFFFIFVANLLDVIPGVDTVGWLDHKPGDPAPLLGFFIIDRASSNHIIPWIRPATTDLNLTLAMALVSVAITQIFGFISLGAGVHLNKYINVKALRRGGLGIVEFIVGLLEIVSELSRLISFSFRLFGNIFAGSILLAVFAFLLPAVANIIFIPFEIFIAGIQAFVFAFLTLLFLELGTTSHAHHDEGHAHLEGAHEVET